MKSQKLLCELRHERRRNGLSLADVAVFYRGGRTRERIRAIESAKSVSADVKRDFLAAITAATAEIERKRKILTHVRRELAKETENSNNGNPAQVSKNFKNLKI
jgi:hypothetical protein